MAVWEIHPALVHFPIALLIASVVVDAWAALAHRPGLFRVGAGLLIAGIAAAAVTAIFGLVSYFTVPAHTEASHERMIWHGASAAVATAIFAIALVVRWRRPDRAPPVFGGVALLVAAVILVGAGYLGGSIVYHGGAGIDPDLLSAEVREGHEHGHGHDHEHGHTHGRPAPPAHAPR